jgi:hypothetical protein
MSCNTVSHRTASEVEAGTEQEKGSYPATWVFKMTGGFNNIINLQDH